MGESSGETPVPNSMRNLVAFSLSRRVWIIALACLVCVAFVLYGQSSGSDPSVWVKENPVLRHRTSSVFQEDTDRVEGEKNLLLRFEGTVSNVLHNSSAHSGVATLQNVSETIQDKAKDSEVMLKELYSKVDKMTELLALLRKKNDELQNKLSVRNGSDSRYEDVPKPSLSRPADVMLDTARMYYKGGDPISYLTTAFWRRSNPHDFKLLIDEPHFCKDNKLSVVITVLSALDHHSRRDRIRNRWGKWSEFKDYRSRALFLLGTSSNETIMNKIRKESLLHHDIIQEDFVDSYENLTLKSVMALKWTSHHCTNVRYMLKLDDDVVNFKMKKLFLYLAKQDRTFSSMHERNSLLCNDIKPPTQPIRELSKWHASREEYPDQWYPRYCNGCDGYMVSIPAAKSLYKTSLQTRFFRMEDVYITGILPLLTGNTTLEQLTYF